MNRKLQHSLKGRLFLKGNRPHNLSLVGQTQRQEVPLSTKRHPAKDSSMHLPRIQLGKIRPQSRRQLQSEIRLKTQMPTQESEKILPSKAAESRIRIKTEYQGVQTRFSRVIQRMTGSSRQTQKRTLILPQQQLQEAAKPGSVQPSENKAKRLSQKEFVYLIKNQTNDHYNLTKIDFKEIIERKLTKVYFTLSVRGLTRYESSIAREFIGVEEWLSQRDKFNDIKRLSFFTKFRKWKVVKQWVKILAQDRKMRMTNLLRHKLFYLHNKYSRILIEHRQSCCKIQKIRFVDVDVQETYTLAAFKDMLNVRCKKVIQGLHFISETMHTNFTKQKELILDDLKQIVNARVEQEGELFNQQPERVDTRSLALQQLGLSGNMNYSHKLIMRERLIRLLRLAYLLDFFTLQALSNLYVLNAQQTLQKYQKKAALTSWQKLLTNQVEQLQSNQKFYRQPGQPIFLVKAFFKEPQSQPLHIISDYSIARIRSDQGLFDLNFYVQVIDDLKLSLVADQDPLEERGCRIFPQIQRECIGISPESEQLIGAIQEMFIQGQDAIQVISRWSKSKEFVLFVQALQDYDVIIGQNWGNPQSKFLNPSGWIREHPIFKSFISTIKHLMQEAYRRVQVFIAEHNHMLSRFWRIKTTKLELIQQRVLNLPEVIKLLISQIMSLKQKLQKNFLFEVDLGIVRVDFQEVLDYLKQDTDSLLKQAVSQSLAHFKTKASLLKLWFEQSISQLSGIVIQIQQFIAKKSSLQKIAFLFSDKRQQVNNAVEIYFLLEHLVPDLVPKNEKTLAQQIEKLQVTLANSISEADIYINKNMDKSRKNLKIRFDKLQKESQELRLESENEMFNNHSSEVGVATQLLQNIASKAQALEQVCLKLIEFEQILQSKEKGDFQAIRKTKDQILIKYQLWEGIKMVQQLIQQTAALPTLQVSYKDIKDTADLLGKRVARAERIFPDNKATTRLKKSVWKLKQSLPILAALKQPNLLEQHWQAIRVHLDSEFDIRSAQFTFQFFLRKNLKEHSEQIQYIAQCARQESSLRSQLQTIQAAWQEADIKIKSYRQNGDIFVITEIDDLFVRLDEGLANISALLSSRFIVPLRSRAQKVQQDLLSVQEIVEKWTECQKKWLYLQNIFSGPDMRKSLPQASKDFQTCDKFLKGLMKRMYISPKFLRLLKIQGLTDSLIRTQQSLNHIQHLLQDYLQLKRKFFPRFYFLSNDELLLILARPSPPAVQLHINKCFEGVSLILLQRDTLLTGVSSPQGQKLQLINSFPTTKSGVEVWLDQLQKGMLDALKRFIKSGLNDLLTGVVRSRQEWIGKQKGQVVSVVSQVLWCSNTEQVLNEMANKPNGLSQWYQQVLQQLSILSSQVAGELPELRRKVLISLITAQVHNRDIISNLLNGEVQSVSNFEWQKQLRYYFEQDKDEVITRQSQSTLPYGYQYLGATSRLVITPLTDRCWMTITTALLYQLGASPAGPAGTGKTQSTKDLAKGLARICIVFNCSDQITTQMTSRLFTGLACQGAWACLDEFNRIEIQVLSVIAQQLQSIRVALIKGLSQFQFEGRETELRRGYGCFVTMNPGYAGRTQLPDNLKSLFRPVSMMIPDYALIAQIMLFAEGFEEANTLSKKMVQLYKLSSEQLSSQDHYDFGMRAVKSLLVTAGTLKRKGGAAKQQQVLIEAMRNSNLPKFTREDIPLFENLIKDLFPNFLLANAPQPPLKKHLVAAIQKQALQPHQPLFNKIIQLQQTLAVRFGVMTVGKAVTGKTTVWRVLAQALCKSQRKVLYTILNPKSISIGEMYGQIQAATGEWRDGLASSIIRQHNQPPVDQPEFDMKAQRWIVFDGPVDALWIQNLNTVLDDNKTLCLASGQRIKLRDQLRMLFQVQNLAVASPATVSRCGMVYTCQDTISWRQFYKAWAKTINFETRLLAHLEQLVDKIMLQFVPSLQNLYMPFNQCANRLFGSLSQIVSPLLLSLKCSNRGDQDLKKVSFVLAWGCIWSMGCLVGEQSYNQLEERLKACFPNMHFPRTQSIFDFFVNPEGLSSFLSYETLLVNSPLDRSLGFYQLLVPTVATVRYQAFLKNALEYRFPVLVTGVSGSGKTVITSDFLRLLGQKQKTVLIELNFSAQTKSGSTQTAIESKLFKKGKTLFGARPKERIVIKIDDINMPALDTFGSIPPIELLRQLIDKRGFYDPLKLFWKEVTDTSYVFIGGNPGGGRNSLPSRFVRHFQILCMSTPSLPILNQIFSRIMSLFFQTNKSLHQEIQGLVKASLALFSKIKNTLLPTPSKFHYVFTTRDLGRLVHGLTSNKKNIWRCWAFQVQRVFADRIGDQEDLNKFLQILEQTSNNFNLRLGLQQMKSILITNLLQLDGLVVQNEEVTQPVKLIQFFESQAAEMNATNLVFFRMALQQIVKFSRVLSKPRGNLLLIGLAGSGKQTLAVLSAFLIRNQLIKTGTQPFRNEMQTICKTAGAGTAISYLAKDIKESQLQDLSNLMNTGQIPGLFGKKQEMEDILQRTRKDALQHKIQDSSQHIYSFWLNRLRDNLHIVFGISPVGPFLRNSCRKFPALITSCALVWCWDWPDQALREIALKELAEMKEQTGKFVQVAVGMPKIVKEGCKRFMENTGRQVYTTPQSFLDHLRLFKHISQQRRNSVGKLKLTLSEGVHKLDQTNQKVALLEIKMKQLKPLLVIQSQKAESAMKNLLEQTTDVNQKEAVVTQEASVIEGQRLQISSMVDQVNKELQKVLPLLAQARDAVSKISKAEIAQLKKYSSPPPPISMVLEAICVLLGQKTEWAAVKKVISQFDYLDRIKSLDPASTTQANLKKLKTYTGNPGFDPLVVGKSSQACKSLCQWTKAFGQVSRVSKQLQPKKVKAAALQKQLRQKNFAFSQKNEELRKVRERVVRLQKEFEVTSAKKQKIEEDKVQTQARLQRAGKLQLLLGDQEKRWREQIQSLKEETLSIEGDCLISAGIISYLSPFSKVFRQQMLADWIALCNPSIRLTHNFTLLKVLESPLRQLQWASQGLPIDSFSLQNACIYSNTMKSIYLIDPENQAIIWLSRENKVKTVKNDENLTRSLQTAIMSGVNTLVLEVGAFLDRNICSVINRSAKEREVKVGQMKLPITPQFKLILATSKANPKLEPQVFIRTTVINFSTTMEGLSDQLLSLVFNAEKPQLQQQKAKIIVDQSEGKKKLKEAQDLILRSLSQSKMLVIDDVELIKTLESSKAMSLLISDSLKANAKLDERINFQREEYVVVAQRAALLYFVIADLSHIEWMYQNSLNYFRRLFLQSIASAAECSSIQQRKTELMNAVTTSTYQEVSKGLFENHKKIYAFLIASSIDRLSGEIEPALWNLFTKGAGLYKRDAKDPANPDKTWLSQQQWNQLLGASKKCSSLTNFPLQLRNNLASMKWLVNGGQFMFCELPSKIVLPVFTRLCLIKLLKNQLLSSALNYYTANRLGSTFSKTQIPDLAKFIQDVQPYTPVIFILSQGMDPSNAILQAADSLAININNISLGQGQGKKAQLMIEKGKQLGQWVLLQNCHLSISWMPAFESIVAGLQVAELNPGFRLIATSMPSESFPVLVLQNGSKLTSQPPKGFKTNLGKSISNIGESELQGRTDSFTRLLFSLSIFHAIIQERRKFGSLGFNIRYEFNDNDLDISKKTLMNLVVQEHFPLDALIFVTGNIHYGGRVTDDNDRNTLLTTLKRFYTNDQIPTLELPQKVTLQFMKGYVQGLQEEEPLELLGLHQNAKISFLKEEASLIQRCILATEQAVSQTKKDNISNVILEFTKQLPQPIKLELASFHNPNDLTEQSLQVFLRQQATKLNRLLEQMSRSLKELEKGIRGEVLLTEQLEEMINSFGKNNLPALWRKVSYSTLKKLFNWFQDLKLRVTFIRNWISKEVPLTFWLGGLFFPQGFLTAVFQTHARKYKIPIDSLAFRFKVIDQKQVKTPKDGVLVSNLFVQGAGWDISSQSLVESKINVMYHQLPAVKFQPVQNYQPPQNVYRSPCYKTTDRVGVLSTTGQSTNFVCFVDLVSKKERTDHWTLRGTAVVCQLEE